MKKSVIIGMALGIAGTAAIIHKNKHIAKWLMKRNG